MIYEWKDFNILFDHSISYVKYTIIFLNYMWHRKWEQEIYPRSLDHLKSIILAFNPIE